MGGTVADPEISEIGHIAKWSFSRKEHFADLQNFTDPKNGFFLLYEWGLSEEG